MEDEELVKMFNLTLKRRKAILFFLIVVINGLKCIILDIGLNTCARGGEEWRYQNWKYYSVSRCVISIIIVIAPTICISRNYFQQKLPS